MKPLAVVAGGSMSCVPIRATAFPQTEKAASPVGFEVFSDAAKYSVLTVLHLLLFLQPTPLPLAFHLLLSCLRLGLQPLAYLWHQDQESLLSEMISSDLHAILIKVAAYGEFCGL